MDINEEGSEHIKEGYTRVSDILHVWSKWDDMPARGKEQAERKRRIGIRVHEAIHMFNNFIPTIFGHDDEEDAAEKYFESAIKWMQQLKVDVVGDEVRLYDDTLMITGGLDALVHMPGEEGLILVDWKAASTYNKQIALSWSLQGAFYSHLLRHNKYAELTPRMLFLQLDNEGGLPKLREFTFTPALLDQAMLLLKAYRVFNPIQ
jgi:hypothetical protein